MQLIEDTVYLYIYIYIQSLDIISFTIRINKQSLDEVFVICGIIKVEVSVNTCPDLDNFAFSQKPNSIIVLLYISRKIKHYFTVLLARFYICFLFQRIPHAVMFCIVGSTCR